MISLKQPVIYSDRFKNSKGEALPVMLTPQEKYHAEWCQRQVNDRFRNSLGYEVSITTLTTIMKKITEQLFYEIRPSEYLPVVVGEGAWSSNLTTYRSFEMGDEFETGIINTGGGNARLASADAGVDALNIKVFNWAKAIGWNIFDLELAARSGNWDLVSAKERARKINWDLGIQRIAFLGMRGQNASGGSCQGLLNQDGITVSNLIGAPISGLSPTDLKYFVQNVVEVYRNNNQRTKFPDRFVIPESDYNGLASQASAQFPVKSTLQLLEEAFALICRKPGFKILPLAYGDIAYSGFTQQVYVLYSYDEESLRMNVPVSYTNTLANSLDNFNFQSAAYGQTTGVLAYRPLDMLYFKYTP